MGENAKTSIAGRIFGVIKAIAVLILKLIYIAPLVGFGLYLLSTVYFSDFDLHASLRHSKEKQSKPTTDWVLPENQPVPRGHFHMTDTYVTRQETNPSNCVFCHSTYAHNKEKKVRALLNMHDGFIACSVCHVTQTSENQQVNPVLPRQNTRFLWVDRDTGKMTNHVNGEYGKYPAMIYPIETTGNNLQEIFRPIKVDDAKAFLKAKPGLTEEQIKAARKKLHALISEKPVSCADCHRKDGYLNFTELGFPKVRVDYLVSSEIVGMIDKYKTFHLPSVIDFRGK